MAVRPGWVNQQLLPFDSHFADVEGARVHHKTRATGPYSSVSRQSDWSFLYRHIVRGLTDRFRCIALDYSPIPLERPSDASRWFRLDDVTVMGRLAPTWAAGIAGTSSIALSAVWYVPTPRPSAAQWQRLSDLLALALAVDSGVGVVGWDEGAFAGAGYKRPVESGLQVVVEAAQRVEFVQPGVFGLRPGFLVVVLDPPAVAALHRAGGVGP
jgi:hypothetical protein